MTLTKEAFVNMCTMFTISVLHIDKMLIIEEENLDPIGTIYHQLIRSASSITANLAEALRGCSYKDYIHKMHIADKEAHETERWLAILKDAEYVRDIDAFDKLYADCIMIVRIFEIITDADPDMRDWFSEKDYKF